MNHSESLIVSLLELVDRQGQALQAVGERLTILENSAFDNQKQWRDKELGAVETLAALTKKVAILEEQLNLAKLDVLTQTDFEVQAYASTQTEAEFDLTVDLSSERIDVSETAKIVVPVVTVLTQTAHLQATPATKTSSQKPKNIKKKVTLQAVESKDFPWKDLEDKGNEKFYAFGDGRIHQYQYLFLISDADGIVHVNRPDFLSDFVAFYDLKGYTMTQGEKRRLTRLFNSANLHKTSNAFVLALKELRMANRILYKEQTNALFAYFIPKALELESLGATRVAELFGPLLWNLSLPNCFDPKNPTDFELQTCVSYFNTALIGAVADVIKAACFYAIGGKTIAKLKPRHVNLLTKIRENRYALIQRFCYGLYKAKFLSLDFVKLMGVYMMRTQAEMAASPVEMNTIDRMRNLMWKDLKR
ncbi:hypothetical protein L596_029795 [Steinernema carpocapsae]|uniref:Uncharacterized protein n=1 Tax=Steinernema carpocapsae TaxID=34508 RepID=A0A4U5LQT6_STECR|nr:hypothetical protein L596_029795 [Steinernema carpocapsae]